MIYALLAYRDEGLWEALPSREREAVEYASRANVQDLRQSGQLLALVDLQGSNAALRVQILNDEVTLTDSPFSEARELLRRVFVIQARDLNEAIQAAAKMPQARMGPIEVRPILGLDLPSSSNEQPNW